MSTNGFHRIDRTIGYTVKDIITPTADLMCWMPEENNVDALRTAAQADEISFLPVKKQGKIVGVVPADCLEEKQIRPLTVDWLIAADTPILHLITLFAENPERVFLVLESSHIIGLVAPADLNKLPARASLYLLTAHFEAELAQVVRYALEDDESRLGEYLSEGRIEKLKAQRDDAGRQDMHLSLFHWLYITDLTEIIACREDLRDRLGFTSKGEAEKALSFRTLRNNVSHMTNLVVASREELKKLDDQCKRLIDYSAELKKINGAGVETIG